MSPYALSVYGGVQEQVLAMSRVLSARGDDVLVLAPDARDDAHYDTPAEVLRFGRLMSVPANGSRAPLTLSPRAAFQARGALAIVCARRRALPRTLCAAADLGEPSCAPLPVGGHASIARFGTRTQVRCTDHSLSVQGIGRLGRRQCRRGRHDRIVTGTECDVLFNGFETERFVTSARERSVEVVLLFVGRLDQRKGVATVIEATREHNARGGRPWRLVIAGDGPDRARLEALAAHDGRVVFLGRVSDAQKRSWMRRVHVLVAPSTHGESFGLVLLEGMSSETLVVASDIHGYREAAGGHASLFHPGDAHALEQAIDAALAEESDDGIKAARAYAENWSMTKLVEEYETRYELAQERFGHPVA